MKDVIRWFVLLLHKDMQNFVMDKETDQSIQKQIMEKTITKEHKRK